MLRLVQDLRLPSSDNGASLQGSQQRSEHVLEHVQLSCSQVFLGDHEDTVEQSILAQKSDSVVVGSLG